MISWPGWRQSPTNLDEFHNGSNFQNPLCHFIHNLMFYTVTFRIQFRKLLRTWNNYSLLDVGVKIARVWCGKCRICVEFNDFLKFLRLFLNVEINIGQLSSLSKKKYIEMRQGKIRNTTQIIRRPDLQARFVFLVPSLFWLMEGAINISDFNNASLRYLFVPDWGVSWMSIAQR